MEPTPQKENKIAVVVGIASLCGAAIATAAVMFAFKFYGDAFSAISSDTFSSPLAPAGAPAPGSCNVMALQLGGQMLSSRSQVPVTDFVNMNDGVTLITPNYTIASDIEYYLSNAKLDESIKAVLLDVDTYGGTAQAGEEIARAIRAVGKPTVAVIQSVGASSGYLAAAAADRIFALKSSTVGSIGVTMSYLSYVDKNEKEGISYVTLSSGTFKDMMSPDKPLTEEERKLAMRDVAILKDNFVRWVAEYRKLSVEKVEAMADGSTVLGDQALQNGLIDEIGGISEAMTYLESKIGEPVTICWQ